MTPHEPTSGARSGEPWQQIHADDADLTVDHPIVADAIDEAVDNLARVCGTDPNVARIALLKVASYAAQVGAARALRFDPVALSQSSPPTPDEAAAAERAVRTGRPADLLPVYILWSHSGVSLVDKDGDHVRNAIDGDLVYLPRITP